MPVKLQLSTKGFIIFIISFVVSFGTYLVCVFLDYAKLAHYLMPVWLLISLYGLLYIIIGTFYTAKKVSSAPDIRRKAKVLSKHTQTRGAYNIDTEYFITFEFDNVLRVLFQVDVGFYGMFVEGEEGILTYKEYKNNRLIVGFSKF